MTSEKIRVTIHNVRWFPETDEAEGFLDLSERGLLKIIDERFCSVIECVYDIKDNMPSNCETCGIWEGKKEILELLQGTGTTTEKLKSTNLEGEGKEQQEEERSCENCASEKKCPYVLVGTAETCKYFKPKEQPIDKKLKNFKYTSRADNATDISDFIELVNIVQSIDKEVKKLKERV
jgi:hypothetical protein